MKDKLGQPLDIGDEVVYPENNHLKFGTVMRFLGDSGCLVVGYQLDDGSRLFFGDSGCLVVGYQTVKSRFSIIKVSDHAEKTQ